MVILLSEFGVTGCSVCCLLFDLFVTCLLGWFCLL